MKKIFLVLLCCSTCFVFSQKTLRYYEINNLQAEQKAGFKNSKKIKYFSSKGREISKSTFDSNLASRKFFQIPGDSLNHRKLVSRENHGQLKDYQKFTQLLETELGIELDKNKPIIVIYHPGMDRCNSSGSASKRSINRWYKKLESGISGKSNDLLFIFKNNEGMKKKYDLSKWQKDPQGIMEQLFFPYHFPCSSFVVISKTGRYISYFGEYGHSTVWKALDFLLK